MSRGLSARSLSARRPAKAAPEIAQLGRDRGHLRRDARGSGSRVAGAVTQIGNADGLRRTSRTRRVCVSESTTDGRTALSGRAADWRKQVLELTPSHVTAHNHGDHRSHPAVRGSDLRHHAVVGPTARANTGRPRSLHARALSGGRQSGKAGRSR